MAFICINFKIINKTVNDLFKLELENYVKLLNVLRN